MKLDTFSQNNSTSKFILKVLPIGATFFQAGGRTDRQDETKSRFSKF